MFLWSTLVSSDFVESHSRFPTISSLRPGHKAVVQYGLLIPSNLPRNRFPIDVFHKQYALHESEVHQPQQSFQSFVTFSNDHRQVKTLQ